MPLTPRRSRAARPAAPAQNAPPPAMHDRPLGAASSRTASSTAPASAPATWRAERRATVNGARLGGEHVGRQVEVGRAGPAAASRQQRLAHERPERVGGRWRCGPTWRRPGPPTPGRSPAPRPCPAAASGVRPPSTTVGMPVDWLLAMPVTALVNPGPAVTPATPVSPVQRAHASAMKHGGRLVAGADEADAGVVRSPARPGAMWPPGRKNRCDTPGGGEHLADHHAAVVLGHGRGDPRRLRQQRVGGSSGVGGSSAGPRVGDGHLVAAHGR